MPEVTIEWREGEAVSGTAELPSRPTGPPFLLAHGAGGSRRSQFMRRAADGLAAGGRAVLAFDYPYVERGRRAPDRPEVLLASHGAVHAWWRERVGEEIVLGGKSMGGRMASHLVAEGAQARGLVFFGYPLHPPGRPERLRDAHLPGIGVPMLFLAGTRDPFCRLDLLEGVTGRLSRTRVEVIEGGDHSFRVPKRTGRSWEEVIDGLVAITLRWSGELS